MRTKEEVNPKRVEILFGIIGGIKKNELKELDKRLSQNSSGINSMYPSDKPYSILHTLAVNDNCVDALPVVEKYIENNLYDTTDFEGETPLMSAITSGKLKNAEALIESQTRSLKKQGKTPQEIKQEIAITINTPDLKGSTPLHAAADSHRPAFIKFLLSHGANPQALDNNNNTPAIVAAKEKDGDIEMIKTIASLVKSSKELNTPGKDGKTLLETIRDTQKITWGTNMEKLLIQKCDHTKSGFSLWR